MGELLDLTAHRMWHGGSELERLWAGEREWVRPVVLTVSGATVSTFQRDGIDYTQILFRQSGSMQVSGSIAGAQYALVGGGGSGGYVGRSPGGGGAGEVKQSTRNILLGNYDISIGAGGAGGTAAGNGIPGSASTILRNGAAFLSALGGGYGGGSQNGGDGACGGGGGTNSAPRLGGVGSVGGNGGSAAADGSGGSSEGGGGGGGMGGPGQDGQPLVGGNGGSGVSLEFCEPPLPCAGGGGGASAGKQGGATHGGTPATRGVISSNAINGGGSGASNMGRGNGGDGLFVLTFPSTNAVVEAA